ncbi:hypothetical protein Tsubulata_025917 [Turnera subulata]|uniref:Neprosin PEP catalytic domain-containing protein n=1 Tax=Turnera subulata TaxID=218843 RepID=A0A9Q0FU13_9ROSI|nr:hypothetical protein Tsubulata_025917 [Turnera subulata]
MKNEDGTIFDCIEMNKQPAFDHPLLKNHTIQLQPSSIPKGLLFGAKSSGVPGASKRKGVDCPVGTVPIRRTTKEDLLKAKALSTTFTMAQAPPSIGHYAGSGKQGCYNILCSGFVQTSSKHPLGDEILRASTYGGEQFSMVVLIVKDPKTGNWLLLEAMDDAGQVQIGYWPSALFSGLAASAGGVQFGGEAYSPPGVPPPAIGSGHFELANFRDTSYISHIQFVDSTLKPYDPANVAIGDVNVKCFRSKYLGDTQSSPGYASLFGGPGGCL